MEDHTAQIVGLIGFIASGLFFTASSIRTGDELTVIGSIVWIGACIVWLVPLIRRRR
jgi:hypothetical protein